MLNVREVLFLDVKLIKIRKNRNRQTRGFIVQANKQIIIIVLFVVFFLGLILGHTFFKSSSYLQNTVNVLFSDYIEEIISKPFIKVLTKEIIFSIMLLLITFIIGLCAVGFPFSVFLLLIKGLSIGALSSCIYTVHGIKGFGFCMLVFYPIQILNCLILLRAGKESFEMSMSILRYITTGRLKVGENADFRVYLIKFLTLTAISSMISLLSAVLLEYITPLLNF